MIYLDPRDKDVHKAFRNHIDNTLPWVRDNRDGLTNLELKAFLTDERIRSILGDPPGELLKNHECLLNALPSISVQKWERWLEIKRKTKNLCEEDENIKKVFKKLKEDIESVFTYDGGFAVKDYKPYGAYELAGDLKRQTCVYCNRQYTKTVIIKKNGKKITRPQFDHWFPKGSYPLLALSFYNLIPSCNTCNSNVKGEGIMQLSEFLHPYIDRSINYSFSYWLEDLDQYEFDIQCKPSSKEERTIDAFQLKAIYNAHVDEIEDLVLLKKRYPGKYLKSLQKLLGEGDGKKTSPKIPLPELYRLAFGVHYEKKDFHKRPLSKMKHDILKELKIIPKK